MKISRRNLALLALVPAAATLASCTGEDVQNLETQLAAVIDKISKAVKAACGAVPVASFVVQVLQSLAPAGTGVAALAAFAEAAIAEISKVCPAPTPVPQATGPMKVNGKDVFPAWY